MKTNRTLNNAFPIVAAALGNNLGVKVIVGGEDARTNGDTIQIPAYDGDDPDYRDVAWGYLAHEAGHVRFTDMECFRQASQVPIRKAILNVLEDVRIERQLAEMYPGTRLTIEKTIRKMIDQGDFAMQPPNAHPAAVLDSFLLFHLRTRELGQTALSDLADEAERLLEERFPTGAVTRLFGLLSEVPRLGSTRDCLILTDRILRMIEEELAKAEEEVEKPPRGESGTGGAPDNTQADPGKTDSPTGDPDEIAQPKADAPVGDSDQNAPADVPNGPADAAPAGDSHPATDGNGVSPASVPSDGKADDSVRVLRAVLSARAEDVGRDLFECARKTLSLTTSQASNLVLPAADEPPENPENGRALLDKTVLESTRIRSKLQGLVQASRLKRPALKSLGRKISGNRLHRLATGDPRVFEQRLPQTAPNTAVHVLLDRSPSMRNTVVHQRRIDIAWVACVALALALEGIPGVNPAITAFPGHEGRADSVYRVMDHGQRVRQRAPYLGFETDGGTPLAQGLWYAASRVLACREPRKVILVLTDGKPDSEAAVRDILDRCTASGIEVVGIGLGITVGHLFERSISILEIQELRERLFELSRDLLIAA
ncbi:VWA domain-containing protein [Methylocaldum szegediense]|uniref:VWA domain-containing protein n=1 Tax=Methylocaldum szegediense TaxID=73780 RepID=UPI0003FE2D32|nr:VWA domain-containing protein [Methylocaldum szegediense]